MNFAIKTTQLKRVYKIGSKKKKAEIKELMALEQVDLEVRKGELFGLLGPNGAGKTTLIKILTTLLAPTAGQALVAGYDVAKDPDKVRPLINMVSGGETSGYGLLTVRENLWMFSQFYGIPTHLANQRINELLEVVHLSDRAGTKSSDLSTGLRQKMNIIRGFMTDPDILFLDEPTLGLDVGASREVRQYVRTWVNEDPTRTLLLTTHYMVEADELCDRVAIINKGKVLACDTPARLKRELQSEVVFNIEVGKLDGVSLSAFRELPGVTQVTHTEHDGSSMLEFVVKEDSVLSTVIGTLTDHNLPVMHLQKREPTLEDVFVSLVGRSMADVEKVEQEVER